MPALDCPTRAELDSFQAGNLDDIALTTVASHVESCSKCQRSLETIIGNSSDTILAALLAEPTANPFAEEIACRHVVDRVSSMAGDERLAGKESAPTIALDNPRNIAGESTLPVEMIREYKLLAKLGEGGMGAVYKALHTRLDKVVALKVLPEGRIRDAGSVARFQREMKAVGRLDHPNIVRAMDAGEEGGTHFLVMEYVEGADLSDLAKNIGPLPVADACELVRQAAVGLQEAHEHGMVHRDIKPSNLILAKSPRKKSPPTLKILDLGLALLSEGLAPDRGLTTTGAMMGTIDYMAPEQGSDTHNVDIRADIYSLGATLYRLLTGSAPFAGEKFDTPVKKILALATKEPAGVQTIRADVPPALAAIVHKMLAKDPAERFATPEELAEALAPFCQGANLAALLEHGNRTAQSKVSGEAPTHPQLSSPSVATAPTIDYSIKEEKKSRPASPLTFAGLGRRIPRSLAIAAACGGVALAVLLGVVFYLETLKGTIRIEINDDQIKVALDKQGATFEGIDKMHSVRVQPGPHGLTVTRGDLKFDTDKFELRKGETLRLSVRFLAGRVQVVDAASGKSLGNSSWHGWPKDAPAPAIAPFDAKQARKHQDEWASYLGVPEEYENTIGMKFVLIPPGEFMMGSTPTEIEEALKIVGEDKHWQECIKSEAPKHKVILAQPIYLGAYEVTQAEYEKVMGKNPSWFSSTGPNVEKVAGLDTAGHPVDDVSWHDAAEFCAQLSDQEKFKPFYSRTGKTVTILEGTGYRLPTEAQWEFACRAGTTTKYWTGDDDGDLQRAAWFGANSGNRTHRVGELKGNPLGLYDIHGNVWEWVQDRWEPTYYGQFQAKPAINPSGPSFAGSPRLTRGGGWVALASICRASLRLTEAPNLRAIGFRVALTVDAVKATIAERKHNGATPIAGWPKDAPKPAIAPFDAKQARKHQEEWASYLGVPVEYENSLRIKFVLIPPGEYLMGSPTAEVDELVKAWDPNDTRGPVCIKSATPQHRVILTRPMFASIHEVTQKNYQAVMGNNPSVFAKTGETRELAEKVAGMDTADFAVDSVSWLDATDFCSELSRREKLESCYSRVENKVTLREANGYRLPSEAEWEFTCRAGSTTPYSAGSGREDLFKAGWFAENSGGRRHAVGELQANPFGLYDLHGNAWEWVQDWWEPSYPELMKGETAVNPRNESVTGKSERVLRGGNWRGIASLCRSSFRDSRDYWHRHQDYGFRVWLSTDAVKAAMADRKNTHALLFDDRTAAVDLSEVTYDGSHDLTIEGWFKTLEFGHCEFARFEPDGPTIFAMPKGKLGEIGAQWKDDNGKDVYAVCVEKLRVGQWQHVALVYRRQKMLLFVDGEPIAESEVPTKTGVIKRLKMTNALMELGGLRISRKSRYTIPFQPERRFASDADTLALFHCDEGAGEVLKDSSGHDCHGKIVGAKWVSTTSIAARKTEPPSVDREVNGTVFPAYAAAPLHLVKQKSDFAEVRAELELLRKSSKQNYHVVILPTLGDYLPRAADYLRQLAEEWQQDATARKEPFDAERLVIIVMAMNDQQLQIHFGPKLKDGLGLDGPPVTRELLLPHFLPFAKQGKLSEGLVSLLRGTEKWIAEREAAKNDKPK